MITDAIADDANSLSLAPIENVQFFSPDARGDYPTPWLLDWSEGLDAAEFSPRWWPADSFETHSK
jgi:hypothetical protein